MHHFQVDEVSEGDRVVLLSALENRREAPSGDTPRRKKKPGGCGSQRVLAALLKTRARKLKSLYSDKSKQERGATFTDDEESDGEWDFDENVTYTEDSLSILRGEVDTPLGTNLPVWVVTDTGNMTRLIEDKYASSMKFERRPLPSKSQFSIHSPGGGSDHITEMVVLNVRVKAQKVTSIDILNHATTEDQEVERTIRMSFGVCSSLPVPILWGGGQARKYDLLDLHNQKSLAFTLGEGERYLTKSTSWLVAAAQMRDEMTRPLKKALSRFAPSRERLANMVKGSREAFNMYTVLYPGRENVVRVNRKNACIDQGFNSITCTNAEELAAEFGDMITVIDSVSNGESHVVVRNCTDAALSLPAGRVRVMVTPAIAMPVLTPASSDFSILRSEDRADANRKNTVYRGLNWSRRDLADCVGEPEEEVTSGELLTVANCGVGFSPTSSEGYSEDRQGGGVEGKSLANHVEGETVVYAGAPDICKLETPLERPLERTGGSEPTVLFSWNVNGVAARMDPNKRLLHNRFISLIQSKNPDVFCLQELQLPSMEGDPTRVGGRLKGSNPETAHQELWESFIKPFKENYNVFLSLADRSYAGQAMFVRKTCEQPLMSYNFGTAPGHTPNGRLIRADFRRIVVTSLYTPFNGQGRPDQLLRRTLWDQAMLKEVTRTDQIGLKPRIILGDMNVARNEEDMTNDPNFWIGQGDQSIDVCDRGFGGTTANERLRAQEWVAEGHLADTFDPSTAENPYTFLGQGRFRGMGLRLDGFLLDKTILSSGGVKESRIISPGKNREGFMGSDHLPVTLTLNPDWFEREAKLRRDFDSWLDTPEGDSYTDLADEYEDPEKEEHGDRLAIQEMFKGANVPPKSIRVGQGEAKRMINSVKISDEPRGDGSRPVGFPEHLWDLVHPEEKPYVQGRWLKLADPEYRADCVATMLDPKGLDIYDTKVTRTKWFEGGVEGKGYSEEMQLRATALANLDAHFPPRPGQTDTANDVDAEIITVDDRPFKCRPRKYSEVMQAFLTQKTDKMLRSGKLEHSSSNWCHGLVLVPYPDRIEKFMIKHGEMAMSAMFLKEHEEEVSKFFRLCIDLRMLNAKTVPDLFPLPRIDDLLGSVPRGCSRYSISDLDDAFFCARIKEEYRYKTAFVPTIGIYSLRFCLRDGLTARPSSAG